MFHRSHGLSAIPLTTEVRRSALATGYRQALFTGGRVLVRALDRALRAMLGIEEFSDCEECVLRVAFRRALIDVCVPGRIEVKRSDEVIELHFWNENLPAMYHCGSPFGWAVRFRRRMHLSFGLLAERVISDPKFATAKALYARTVLPLDGRLHKCTAVAEEYGFSVLKPPQSAIQKIHDRSENLLVYALIWVFHPGKFSRRSASLERVYWWISREDLLRRYHHELGSVAADSPAPLQVILPEDARDVGLRAFRANDNSTCILEVRGGSR